MLLKLPNHRPSVLSLLSKIPEYLPKYFNDFQSRFNFSWWV